jgi:hypothetical protein
MKKKFVDEFIYKVNNKIKFSGILLSCKCAKTNCKKIISIGLPYCDEHLISEMNVKIKETLNKGKGVFAIKNKNKKSNNLVFQKGSIVLSFDGEFIDKQTLQSRYGDNTGPYSLKISQYKKCNLKYIDAAFHRHVSSLINCSDKNNKPNVNLEVKGDYIYFKANQNIYDGDEILFYYGKQYIIEEINTSFNTKEILIKKAILKYETNVRCRINLKILKITYCFYLIRTHIIHSMRFSLLRISFDVIIV